MLVQIGTFIARSEERDVQARMTCLVFAVALIAAVCWSIEHLLRYRPSPSASSIVGVIPSDVRAAKAAALESGARWRAEWLPG